MTFKRYRIPKAEHGSQEWLNQRYQDEEGNRRISASVAGVLYDVHPFVKPDTYAAELLSGVAPTPLEPNAAMETGNRLEATIIEWAGDRLGIPFICPEEMFCYDNDNGAHLIATLDGWNEEQRHILEVKTTSREYSGTLPDYWRLQGVHQWICADAQRITWAVFDNTLRLTLVEQEVTTDEVMEHISAVESWLNAIALGMDPPGIRYTYETIQTRYQQSQPDPVDLPGDVSDLIARLKHVKSELASYKQLEDSLKAELCELIGPYEMATIGGVPVATWKPQARQFFDAKRFQIENPDVAKQYMRTINNRVLRLKGE
jgi:predicted phage-related endonuclease